MCRAFIFKLNEIFRKQHVKFLKFEFWGLETICLETSAKHPQTSIKDKFGKTAEYNHLLELHGLDAKNLAKSIKTFLSDY